LDDFFEGRYDSLTITGRQKIATKWRADLVGIGNLMLDGRPNAIRKLLESPIVQRIEGEEMGKFFRFAMETAKMDKHVGSVYTKASLEKFREYRTALALEQDASSSGAQIIALTTKNRQLAELSNVIPTNQKKRLNIGLYKPCEFSETPHGTILSHSRMNLIQSGATTIPSGSTPKWAEAQGQGRKI
jgi:hypothetical protein